MNVFSLLCRPRLPAAVLVLAALAVGAFSASAFARIVQSYSIVKVGKAVRFARTMPLRDMRYPGLPPLLRQVIGDSKLSEEQIAQLREKLVKSGLLPPPGVTIVQPLGRMKPAINPPLRVRDPALQTTMPKISVTPDGFTTPGLGFDGLGASTDTSSGYSPPDTNIAVGPNYIVEAVNLKFAVYNKSDGSLAMGPVDIKNLWGVMGGLCLTAQTTDPIVNYDQISHRWLISVVNAVKEKPPVMDYHCVAISQTSDPTSSYYVYAFPIAENRIPDYPKVAVWPGSYLASFTERPTRPSYEEDFVAYDSAQMQNGDPNAQMVEIKRFRVPGNPYMALPVEVDGSDMPPFGTPGLFINYTSPNLDGAGTPYALNIWALRVDWSNPSAATLSKTDELTVDPFTDKVCFNRFTCISQQTSSNKLDAITDRLMYRAAYRNFGDHQAIAAMQSVGTTTSGNPPVGERWYELRAPASSTSPSAWSVYQQGTFGPADGNSRWMGSIAFDHVGNIAMGYSLSGPNQDPEIAYTGRLSTDPLGEMTQPETVLQPAGGSVTEDGFGSDRWGDYSSMQIDPSNDCTFWYANEYFASTGPTKDWSTHIGSMKFANCVVGPAGTLAGSVTDASSGAPIAGATVSINPGNIITKTGSNGTYKDLLPVGNYTVTVTDFGYAPGGPASVAITQDQTTTQDFALAAASTAVLSGKVTDGSGHGYPLYAEIKVTSPGFGQVADLFTNPNSGHYSVSLPMGFDYTLDVQAVFDGYDPGTVTLTLSGDMTKNFALTIADVCTAPGYHFVGGLHEDFNGSNFPPPGWKVTNDIPGSIVNWRTNPQWYDENYTPQSRPPVSDLAATADSEKAQQEWRSTGSFDTSLISPPIAVTSLAGMILQYDTNYRATFGSVLDLDISTDGGSTWAAITHWPNNHGKLYGWPGEHVTVDLSGYIPSSGTFQLRWRYYAALFDGFSAYYAQIDNVMLGVAGCNPIAGGLVEGRVTDGNTGQGVVGAEVKDDRGEVTYTRDNPTDPNLAAGSYELFLPSGTRTLTASGDDYSPATAQLTMNDNAVVTQNLVLKAGKLAANPGGLTLHVMVNNTATAAVALSNSGDGDVSFRIFQINAPPPGSAVAKGPFATALPYNAHANLAAPTPNATVTYRGTLQVPHVSASASATAGTPIAIFDPGIPIYGLAVNHYASDLWLGSPSFDGGDAKDHRFLFDGTNTGDAIDVSDPNILYMADAAYDDNTGMIWQLSVDAPEGGSSHTVEIDPTTMTRTGKSIRVPSPQSERGLAYDPLSNTWYAGDDTSETIYHFDASGTLLDSADVNLPITGLAYNPSTRHLFVLNMSGSSGSDAVSVLDPADGYAVVSRFDIPGFGIVDAGAGFGYGCDNDLWVSNAGTRTVWRVASGETGWCAERNIPWLTSAPASGTLTTGASTNVVLSLDGTDQTAFTTSRAYLTVTNDTRYGTPIVPITVTWDPQPIHLVLTGAASPSPVRKGADLAYDLTVENQQMSNHGAATATMMSYQLPNGVTYVASSGDAVCTESSGTLSCDFGTVDLGASKSETVVVKVAADTSTLTSTFNVGAKEPDSDPSTNTASIKTSVIGGGGGGALGWLALAGLLGLALAGVWARGLRG